MDEAWEAILRYKLLEDKIADLKKNVWANFPPNTEMTQALEDAEKELEQLKAWVGINFGNYQMKE